MQQPEEIQEVALDGEGLTVEQVVAVARHGARVTLGERARTRVQCCRLMVEALVQREEKVYGLTTGFGKLRDVSIAPEDLQQLQTNLIRSHACGLGSPFGEDVVRAAMLLRANTLCRGYSGIRLETLEAVVALINDGLFPYMPEQGSVGASGDLAPLSHLALVVMGDPHGKVYRRRSDDPEGYVRDAREEDFVSVEGVDWSQCARVAQATFRPVSLQAKEGLALNNGTQVMSAIACLVLHDAERGMAWAELACAMSLEAQRGVRHAFHPDLHRVRDLSHQAATAARILGHTAGSEILDVLLNTASLRRVRRYLGEADEQLERTERSEPEGPGREAIARVRQQGVALLEALEAWVPSDPGAAVPDPIAAHRGQSDRQQITAFGKLLGPLRQRATHLLEALNDDGVTDVPMARESVYRAVGALAHAVPAAPPVQDDYSLRCAPQVLACAHRALQHAREVVVVEINSATDNPLLFPPEPPGGWEQVTVAAYGAFLAQPEVAERLAERVYGGGNFHGEPVGMVMDYVTFALAEVANIAERRVAELVDEALSNGLPPFLVESSGLNSGFMIPQYTAAALVSENKVLCHPATADSIPTCAGSEDHVSMGTIAARQAAQVLENVLHVIAIEVFAAAQGLVFRAPLAPGETVAQAVALIRERGVQPVTDDRVLQPDVVLIRELLREVPPGA
ncbi:MAG: aromatic amino acid lyase [Planctomycetota bacterium]